MTAIDAGLAADGIDELIMGFFGRDGQSLSADQLAGRRLTVSLLATDTGGEWLVELIEDGTHAASVQRVTQGGPAGEHPGSAMCTLAGPASGLYRLLWNRADPAGAGVRVAGDASVLAAWRNGMRVTWQ
jgi:MDMPI C-terminal domain